MKRDMDLIRAMLLEVEANPHGFVRDKIEIANYNEEQIGYHAYLLGESGLAKVVDITCEEGESPEAIVIGLTWAGHEFLDSARDEQTWNKAKSIIKKIGGASIVVWTTLLTDLIKKQVGL